MSPYFKLSMGTIIAICVLVVLFLTGCASKPYTGPVSKMPPCYIQGEKGIWFSDNGGQSYRCISNRDLQYWRQRMGL